MGSMNGKSQHGCETNCKIAKGFICSGIKNSICTPICGDQLVVGGETCDLGGENGKNHSGCSDNCTIVKGFTCDNSGSPTVCKAICGDSLVAGDEACDLGSQLNGNAN